TFEMPLALRKARGDYRSAQAKVAAQEAKLRGIRDRIAADVRQSHVDVDAALRQLDNARKQVEAARRLAEAERDKFEHGASDLVIVNLREIAAADAARLEIDALAAYQKALAAYRAATARGI
ncbi:MAG: TolC family protein, partial [Myxococcales bacterium]|nr:TolC family protein [Myxococcales bacterium]